MVGRERPVAPERGTSKENMLILNTCQKKAEIEYPCAWNFKVIGTDRGRMEQAIVQVMGDRQYLLTASRSSSGGKYHSLNLETVVEDEAARNAIYAALKEQADVKMVL